MTSIPPLHPTKSYLIGRVIGVLLIGALIVLFLRLLGFQTSPAPPPVSDSEKYFIDFAPIIGSQWHADPAELDRRVLSESVGFKYTESLSRTTKHLEFKESFIRQEIISYWDNIAASRTFRSTQLTVLTAGLDVGSRLGGDIETYDSQLGRMHFTRCRDANYQNFDLVNCEAIFLCKDRIFRAVIQTRIEGRMTAARNEVRQTLLEVDNACATIALS